MRTIREDYLIKVEGRQEGDGQRDTISLVTKGEFTYRDHSFYITYTETETTGFDGCTTTVKAAADGRRVSLLRFGAVSSQLIVEKDVRHICHYETGQGSLSLGLAADEIRCELGAKGGRLFFSYLLDFGSELLSRNSVSITVKKLVAPDASAAS